MNEMDAGKHRDYNRVGDITNFVYQLESEGKRVNNMRFRSVVEYVDAIQFLPADMSWPEGVIYTEKDLCGIPLKEGIYFFDNGETICEIKPGDWIVTNAIGDRWRWSTKIMKLNFVPVDDCPAWDL